MKDNSPRRILALSVAALALAVLPAHAAPPAETGSTPAAETAKATPTPTEEKAATKYGVPDKIRETCPLYPDSTFISAVENKAMVRAIFGSTGKLEKILGWYKKELTDRKWSLLHERVKGNEARLVMRKGEEQLGFSAQKQKNDSVTYFLSIIKK